MAWLVVILRVLTSLLLQFLLLQIVWDIVSFFFGVLRPKETRWCQLGGLGIRNWVQLRQFEISQSRMNPFRRKSYFGPIAVLVSVLNQTSGSGWFFAHLLELPHWIRPLHSKDSTWRNPFHWVHAGS